MNSNKNFQGCIWKLEFGIGFEINRFEMPWILITQIQIHMPKSRYPNAPQESGLLDSKNYDNSSTWSTKMNR